MLHLMESDQMNFTWFYTFSFYQAYSPWLWLIFWMNKHFDLITFNRILLKIISSSLFRVIFLSVHLQISLFWLLFVSVRYALCIIPSKEVQSDMNTTMISLHNLTYSVFSDLFSFMPQCKTPPQKTHLIYNLNLSCVFLIHHYTQFQLK